MTKVERKKELREKEWVLTGSQFLAALYNANAGEDPYEILDFMDEHD
jgi:hypothetical protein